MKKDAIVKKLQSYNLKAVILFFLNSFSQTKLPVSSKVSWGMYSSNCKNFCTSTPYILYLQNWQNNKTNLNHKKKRKKQKPSLPLFFWRFFSRQNKKRTSYTLKINKKWYLQTRFLWICLFSKIKNTLRQWCRHPGQPLPWFYSHLLFEALPFWYL